MPLNLQNSPNQTMFALSFRNAHISSDCFNFHGVSAACGEHATQGKYAFDERLRRRSANHVICQSSNFAEYIPSALTKY